MDSLNTMRISAVIVSLSQNRKNFSSIIKSKREAVMWFLPALGSPAFAARTSIPVKVASIDQLSVGILRIIFA